MSDLPSRALRSIGWNVLANLLQGGFLLLRMILLARWLPVEVFGAYGLAGSFVSVSLALPGFGLAGAFLHRSQETLDEERAAGVFLTLQAGLVAIWAFLILAASLVWAEGELRTALIFLALFRGGLLLMDPAKHILIRRVRHRRLALIQILTSTLGTGVALALAFGGASLWALLATDLAALAVHASILHLWRPFWRPRFCWRSQGVRYFLSFGSRNLMANLADQTLERAGEIYTGISLGQTSLGYYNRALAFANVPRRLMLTPVKNVLSGAYAELKGRRKELSSGVFRSTAGMIRLSFLAGGLLFAAGPELVALLLTEKWLPMLGAFRLLLIFAMLDLPRRTFSDLFVAVGAPQELIRTRGIQLVVLAAGLLTLGPPFGITGVAAAAILALVVGGLALLNAAKGHVDFSLGRLFGVPSAALAAGLAATHLLAGGWSDRSAEMGFLKASLFSILYIGLVAGLERKQLRGMAAELPALMRGWPRRPAE